MSKNVCSFVSDFVEFRKEEIQYTKVKEQLKKEIEKQIIENEVSHFILGMELGIDMLLAEIIIELKTAYPYITWEAAIPYEEQSADWNEKDREQYFLLIEQCDKETLISTQYTEDCRNKRTQYMTENSDILFNINYMPTNDVKKH